MALSFKSRPALVAYLTCGDPDIATTREIALVAIEAGAEVIELGVPFSDPVADGPVIQRASERALKRGTTLVDVLGLARDLRKETQAGLIVFSYFNPILRFGLDSFCAMAADAGVDGALVTDLTVEESGDYQRAMKKHKLKTVFLAAPTSTDERLRMIAQASTGFVYAVSRTGVTGARKEMASEARDLVRRVKIHSKLPVAVGFGISTPEQVAEVGEFAEAAVVGSAIVQVVEDAGPKGRAAEAVGEFVSRLSAVGRRPSVTAGKG